MEIRRLIVDDAERYRSLMIDGYERHPDAFTASVAERGLLPIAWWANRIEKEFVVGAWHGPELVGVAGLAAQSRPKNRHKATLIGMHVDAAFARQGIGERLVGAILDEAVRRASLRIVQLTVTEGNRAARALYERCGFVPFGVEPQAIASGDGYLSKVHMWIDLATRSNSIRTPTSEASRA